MEWVEYHEIEPWGELMADARHGDMCALTANCHRDADKKPEPFKRSDFSLLQTVENVTEDVDKIMSAEETEDHLKSIFGV